MAHLNFHCDSCKLGIAPPNPRVHCLVCPDYDLCANCALGERYSHGHQDVHRTQVYKLSGGNGQAPIIATKTTFQPPPPSYVAEAPWASFASSPPPLPPRMPPRAVNGGLPYGSASDLPPPLNQRSPEGWKPFFNPDSSPSPMFISLMNEIFTYLDPSNLGHLVPETFSRFLDDMGYLPHENAWKLGLKATFGLSAESMADKSLKNAYDLFSVDHVLLQRVQPAHVDTTGLTAQFTRVLGSSFTPSMLINPATSHSTAEGPMPAITRNGFIEIARVEALSDPSREWGNFSRTLKKYDLTMYRGWGDLPRSVLPNVPDAAMLQRIASVTAYAQRKGQEELAAARIAAEIQAETSQTCIDLVSDTRRVYRYY